MPDTPPDTPTPASARLGSVLGLIVGAAVGTTNEFSAEARKRLERVAGALGAG